MATSLAINSVLKFATIASGGTNSEAISVPARCATVTIVSPDLGGHTYSIQVLSPVDQTTWVNYNLIVRSAGTLGLGGASGFSGSVAVVFDAYSLSGCVIRFVESLAAGATHVFSIMFSPTQ